MGKDQHQKKNSELNMGSDQTRGKRNNNPLNIRFSSNKWQGKVPLSENTDKNNEFEQFTSMKWGLRAAFKNINTYINRGWNTINQIVTHWAPSSDGNNTVSYINHVEDMAGIAQDKEITFNKSDMFPIVKAMARIESAITFTDKELQEAWDLI